MIKLALLQKIQIYLPEIDLTDTNAINRIEKNLKLESKLDNSIQLSDVEVLTDFLKQHAASLSPVLKNKTIYSILTEQYDKIDFKNIEPIEDSDENRDLLDYYFHENISAYLVLLLKEYEWEKIAVLHKYMPVLFGFMSMEAFQDEIYSKVDALEDNILHDVDMSAYYDQHFSTDQKFYRLLTRIDPYYFCPVVNRLTSAIVDVQATTKENKPFLGKMLFAMASFKAEDDTINSMLQKNKPIGEKWMKGPFIGKKLYDKFLDTGPDEMTNKFINGISFVIILGVFYVHNKIFSESMGVGWTFVLLETIIYLLGLKTFNKDINEREGEQSIYWWVRKIAKLLLSIFLVAVVIGAVLGLLIALASTGVGVFPGLFAVISIIRFIIKKNKE